MTARGFRITGIMTEFSGQWFFNATLSVDTFFFMRYGMRSCRRKIWYIWYKQRSSYNFCNMEDDERRSKNVQHGSIHFSPCPTIDTTDDDGRCADILASALWLRSGMARDDWSSSWFLQTELVVKPDLLEQLDRFKEYRKLSTGWLTWLKIGPNSVSFILGTFQTICTFIWCPSLSSYQCWDPSNWEWSAARLSYLDPF